MESLAHILLLTHNKPRTTLFAISYYLRSVNPTHSPTVSFTPTKSYILLHSFNFQSKLAMYEYVTYTKPDLKRMLRQRRLRVSGTKAELVTRLAENDSDQ